jgi:uncharacterized phage protein (TIGR02220 family)
MAHVQLDLDFLTHPKTLATSPLAQLLFIRSLIYAASHLTDGFIPEAALPQLSYDLMQYERLHYKPSNVHASTPHQVTLEEIKKELVFHKRWKKCSGGFRIHDYLDYQLSKRQVLQLIENKRKAGQAGGVAAAIARAQASAVAKSKQTSTESNPIPLPIPLSLVGEKKEEAIVGLAPNGAMWGEAEGLLEFLNQKTGKHFNGIRPNGKRTKTITDIHALLKHGYTAVQIKQVIANRWLKWGNDSKMREYLRPSTLFRPSNFENYLGELGVQT